MGWLRIAFPTQWHIFHHILQGDPMIVRDDEVLSLEEPPVSALLILERAVELATGETVETLRSRTLEENRSAVEAKGRAFVFKREFPFIGRGNVMCDRIVTHADVELALDQALRD